MTLPIQLYLDEDTISRALIRALHARQVDILTAQETEMMGQPDDAQLAFETEQKRTILTFNTRDFVQLHKSYLATGIFHTGIIVSDQIQVGVLIRRLLKLLDAKSAEEMTNWLEFLGNWR
ncbi:MAG: hypothetical protein DWQ04_18220 [Chloroflexi bacterium]|nr:MAG: hypothetical protein DWQ04_18220 [Chloroflexota bacterium]